MKINRILPLILVAPLLVSCGSDFGEPNFKSYSSEITCEALATSFEAKLNTLPILNNDLESRNAKLEMSTASRSVGLLTRAEKLASETVMTHDAKGSGELDFTNYVITSKMEDKTEFKREENISGLHLEGSMVNRADMVSQLDFIDEGYYLVSYNLLDKEIINEDDSSYDLFKEYAGIAFSQTVIGEMFNMVDNYISAPEEDKPNYHFYVDGDVYTATYESNNYFDTAEDNAAHHALNKVQIDFSNGDVVAKSYSLYEADFEFKEYFNFDDLDGIDEKVFEGDKFGYRFESKSESKFVFDDSVSVERLNYRDFTY